MRTAVGTNFSGLHLSDGGHGAMSLELPGSSAPPLGSDGVGLIRKNSLGSCARVIGQAECEQH